MRKDWRDSWWGSVRRSGCMTEVERLKQRFDMLSTKKSKKDLARFDGEEHVGRQKRVLRARRESRADQSFFRLIMKIRDEGSKIICSRLSNQLFNKMGLSFKVSKIKSSATFSV